MRLPYTSDPPQATSPSDLAIVERIRVRRAPRPLQPLDLTLLHSPPVADGWNAFLGAIRTQTTLPASIRELAICRVAVCNKAWYEWGHHAPLAIQAGLPKEAMEIVRQDKLEGVSEEERERAGLGEREWTVLLVTDQMTRKVDVEDATFQSLKRWFGDREVVEIVATVSCYNCVSRLLVALDVGEKNGTGPESEH